MDLAYMLGAVIGSLVVGLIIGAIPLIVGLVKKKTALALGGFAACVVAAFILGALLAVPVCGVFLFFILRKPKVVEDDQ